MSAACGRYSELSEWQRSASSEQSEADAGHRNGNCPKSIDERKLISMKATGIVRRIDDLGRVVIPKEIRRTLRIREGDPSLTTLGQLDGYIQTMEALHTRI